MSDRLQIKYDLMLKLGALFGPLQRLLAAPDNYDEQEKAEALAQFFAEVRPLQIAFRQFSLGQPGFDYSLQNIQFHGALDGVRGALLNSGNLEEVVPRQFTLARAAIDAVPVPRLSVIQEAGTPFTTYVSLKELCAVDAIASITWLDPYMSASIFHRYLTSVRADATITLVTEQPAAKAGKREHERWDALLDVSRLFATERGHSAYRLIVQKSLHDRWIAFDAKRIYSLGGSAKDAGNRDYFTLTSIDGSPANIGIIQQHVDSGDELFGPNTPTHR